MKFRFSAFVVLAVLLILGTVVYLPVFNAPFFYDDYELILNSSLARAIPTLLVQWKQAGLKLLTYATFALNYIVGKDEPFGYHAVNVFLHIFNAWLLYFFARSILGTPQISSRFYDEQKKYIAFVCAVIFLLHPLSTSAVNYVWQRAELLTALCYLAAVIFYIKARQQKNFLYFFVVGILFLLGIFAKGTVVSLPLSLILFECAFWPVSRKKKIFVALFLGTVIGMTFLFLFPMWVPGGNDNGSLYSKWTGVVLTLNYVWTQIYVTLKYFGLALSAFNQNFDYDIPLAASFWEPRIFLSALALCGLIIFAMALWKKMRLISVGIFWFLICLLPSAMMGAREPMWEYRMYLPLAGLTLGLVASVFQVFSFRKTMVGFFIVAIVFAAASFSRNLLWQSPEKLLLDNISKSPQKPNVYQLLGSWYLSQGRIEEAQSCLEKTITLAPDAAESYNNLGLIYKNRGEFDRAEELFRTAIRLRPTLSGAYVNLSYLVLARGEDQKAEEILKEGLQFGQTEGLYACLAKVYLARGQLDQAEGFLQKSLAINPQAAQAYFWYGQLLKARQQFAQAYEMFQKAVEFNPHLIKLVPEEFR
jgi:Tfp pilus assembly protein PilF